jgi:alpha-tubulin suppressor-like RCC1 family protein
LIGAAGLVAATCVTEPPPPAALLIIEPDSVAIEAGDMVALTALVLDVAGNPVAGPTVAWSSTDTTIAAVDSTGIVTGRGAGGAFVVASLDSLRDSTHVDVLVPVAAIVVEPDTLDMVVAGSATPYVAALDSSGQVLYGRAIKWSSADGGVAVVDSIGWITGLTTGSTVIIARRGLLADSIVVNVRTVRFATVSANRFYPQYVTCGVTVAGAAYCWGHGGGSGALSAGHEWVHSTGPVAVRGGLTFNDVRTGRAFACGLTPAGAAWCWGRGIAYRLGTGTTSEADTAAPSAVVGGHTFSVLATGFWHTCGLEAGAAWCWGGGSNGALGQPVGDQSTPIPVSGGLTFTAIEAGDLFTCALGADSLAYCWGDDQYGQLGDGATTSRATPAPVHGGHRFRSLSLGPGRSCGITAADSLYCWGGTGSASVPVDQPSAAGLSHVSVGGGHVCGLAPDGAAYCWGYNGRGALGTGDTQSSDAPRAVVGGLLFSRISAGSGYTCGLTAAQLLYCWGSNYLGQLGDGTTQDRLVPTRVVGQP